MVDRRTKEWRDRNIVQPEQSETVAENLSAETLAENGTPVRIRESREKVRDYSRRVPRTGNKTRFFDAVFAINGFHTEWAPDEGIALDEFYNAGYDFVHYEELPALQIKQLLRPEPGSNRVRQLAGTTVDNRPLYVYLMKIPEEYFQQDVLDRVTAEWHQRVSGILQAKPDGIGSDRLSPMQNMLIVDYRTGNPF